MSKPDWKRLVATVAPALATALGGPLAGAATQALSAALLDGRENGTEQDIATALLTGGTDALTKLRDAENAFTLEMERLGIDLERVHQADRDSARTREASTGDHFTPRALALVVVGSFVGVVWIVLFAETKVEGAVAGTLIGYLSAKAEQIIAYYFGSSAGSRAKSEAMDRAAEQRK